MIDLRPMDGEPWNMRCGSSRFDGNCNKPLPGKY